MKRKMWIVLLPVVLTLAVVAYGRMPTLAAGEAAPPLDGGSGGDTVSPTGQSVEGLVVVGTSTIAAKVRPNTALPVHTSSGMTGWK